MRTLPKDRKSGTSLSIFHFASLDEHMSRIHSHVPAQSSRFEIDGFGGHDLVQAALHILARVSTDTERVVDQVKIIVGQVLLSRFDLA